MPISLGSPPGSSHGTFGAELLAGLAACTELVNTGRPAGRELLRGIRDIESFSKRYAFDVRPAGAGDLPLLRAHRSRLDAAAAACGAGSGTAAARLVNRLLADTGAVPQLVAHGCRGPHIHVSRPAAPLADRIAAQLAMCLAQLLVSGQAGRLGNCASPGCASLFFDASRNQSRRYCDSRTCGNREHAAAYRARRAAGRDPARQAG